ncbi:MAG: PEP-CTERM sorting domain-containing protein, partial [Deltaproteobacteria bacterium]|nr:PEP-CTERM sorting domain-containing protein [Deltaproteobacteria bacterium]
ATGGDATLVVDNVSVTLIPEPSTVLLGLLGLAAICVLPRRRS